jgi:hypothetical protein
MRVSDHAPTFSNKAKKRVDLYLHSAAGLHNVVTNSPWGYLHIYLTQVSTNFPKNLAATQNRRHQYNDINPVQL